MLLYGSIVSAQAQLGGEQVAGMRASIPMCKASDLSLGTDAENGSFNGMSHSGTLLVLRNLSSAACRVPVRPEIGFVGMAKHGSARHGGSVSGAEASGAPLPIKPEIPVGASCIPVR